MRINSINSYTNLYNQKRSNATAPSFGMWDKGSAVKAKKAIQRNEVYHFTALFRNAGFWSDFSKHIQTKFPNGVKFHNYAASDDSESYTIIMKLIDDLGEEKAKKYFPILSNDISATAIKQIKKRELIITQPEEESIFINLKNTGMDKYFDIKQTGLTYNQSLLKVKNSLYSKITPKRADIMKDLNDNTKFDEPCVLLFRNAWYFFTPNARTTLAHNLFSRLKPGSSLIVGSTEQKDVAKVLLEKGFKQAVVDGKPQSFIFERP